MLTCCALHNLHIDKDGLDKGWENGNGSYWNRDYNTNGVNNEIV